MIDVKFPDIEVELSGTDGNAFLIIGKVQKAMRQAGCTKEEIRAFVAEATSGDYDNVLLTAMRTVEVS